MKRLRLKNLRVLALMHPSLLPPESLDGLTEKEAYAIKTEYDIVTTLRRLGHDVQVLGVQDELMPIRSAVTDWKPQIVFNLLEEFHGISEFDQHVVAFLELLQVCYTGCNPRGMVLARGKALSKKLVTYHRIRVPAFTVFPRGRRARPTRGLRFPLIVKSLTEESSNGISQASIVDTPEKLEERVAFIHKSIGTDAIAEQYIEGREIYVGAIGNKRVQVLPIWELEFSNLSPGSAAIATACVKHNPVYQRKHGINQHPAKNLSAALQSQIVRTTRRIFKILELDGYARIDYRLAADGTLYFLEANPNPEIAEMEEFASAAKVAGFPYSQLVQKIVNLGLRRGMGS
jgi:D-alanine-D-alanine ligase